MSMSLSIALSICVLFISLITLVNRAQLLNVTSLFLSSACLAVA